MLFTSGRHKLNAAMRPDNLFLGIRIAHTIVHELIFTFNLGARNAPPHDLHSAP